MNSNNQQRQQQHAQAAGEAGKGKSKESAGSVWGSSSGKDQPRSKAELTSASGKASAESHTPTSGSPATQPRTSHSSTPVTSTGGDHVSSQADTAASRAVKSFDEMRLREDLLRGIYSHGFESPSPIQQLAIMPISQGRDVIAQARSGTGKTGAFAIGSLQQVDVGLQACQVLVLSPTRELAEQTADVYTAVSSRMGIQCLLAIGGTGVQETRAKARQHPHVVTGTPGRVFDLISKGDLAVDRLRCFVLDEADEMLSLGFADQIKEIFALLPPNDMQSVVVSATFPPAALDLTKRFLNDPVKILVPDQEMSLEGIRHFYVLLSREDKLTSLLDITTSIPIAKMMIFVNTRTAAEWLSARLAAEDFSVATMHAELQPAERRAVMERFRSDKARVMVSTDLLARGIDVQQVSLVINYEMTRSRECYVHRIGRCGRLGRKGVVINLVAPNEEGDLQSLRDTFGYSINELMKDFAALFK